MSTAAARAIEIASGFTYAGTNGSNGFRGLYGDVNYVTRVSEDSGWITSVIPEPSTFALLASGLSLVAFAATRRRH